MVFVIPLISSVVSLVFGLAVLDQYFARRKPYQLVWAVGLLMYAVSTGTEFWTELNGLNLTVYRLWYLIGAIFVAAYLGMGTLYLLMKRRHAHIIMGVLLAASAYAVYAVFSADLDISGLTQLTGSAFPTYVRFGMTPVFNTFGTVALAGGALWSAWIFWRKRILPHRVVSNILIAVGAILPAVGGTHMKTGGNIVTFYVLEMLGVIIIFAGFLRSREVFGLYRFPLVHGFGKVETSQPS